VSRLIHSCPLILSWSDHHLILLPNLQGLACTTHTIVTLNRGLRAFVKLQETEAVLLILSSQALSGGTDRVFGQPPHSRMCSFQPTCSGSYGGYTRGYVGQNITALCRCLDDAEQTMLGSAPLSAQPPMGHSFPRDLTHGGINSQSTDVVQDDGACVDVLINLHPPSSQPTTQPHRHGTRVVCFPMHDNRHSLSSSSPPRSGAGASLFITLFPIRGFGFFPLPES
jgi:hypothetical protein